MYIDGTILFGLVIIGLTCYMLYYSARYVIKHIKQDEEDAKSGKL